MKFFACLPRISDRASSDAWKMFSSEVNCLRRALALVGPMLGKPSRMNCCCSGFDRVILVGRSVGLVLGCFLAMTARCFAVSWALRVMSSGVSNSKRTECMKPRMAFSWRPGVV